MTPYTKNNPSTHKNPDSVAPIQSQSWLAESPGLQVVGPNPPHGGLRTVPSYCRTLAAPANQDAPNIERNFPAASARTRFYHSPPTVVSPSSQSCLSKFPELSLQVVFFQIVSSCASSHHWFYNLWPISLPTRIFLE